MPQPNKKRGRRMEGRKRKHEDGEEEDSEIVESSKRRKSTEADHEQEIMPTDGHDDALDGAYPPMEKAFFGMLDDEEQEYFKRADDMLEANTFAEAEERSLFLANVYREADGKELKLAQSQSCSRLMERLIQLSSPDQLKTLFQKFSGNFIHLITHRFASHCCEALFIRAAPVVTEELVAPASKHQDGVPPNDPDEVYATMENLFLHTLAELEGNIGFLLTDRFASHTLRVLLLVLSGEPIDTASAKAILQSKRKETNAVQGSEADNAQSGDKPRTVPDSFSQASEKLITDSIAGLDTEKLRALATHPNGNPTLQLLLKLELVHFGKQRGKDEASIIRVLLPDDPITAGSDSAAFISGLVYDAVGSHLVERIVEHAPGKMFKNLYNEFFKERLPTHARSDTAAYVVCRILERLGHDDLLEAHEILIPTVTNLLQRGRTVVVRTLIERCTIRGIDTQAIAVQIDATWHVPDGFEIKKLLKFDQGPASETKSSHDSVQSSVAEAASLYFSRSKEPMKAHFNILAQAMLLVPGSLSALVLDSLIGLDAQTLIDMAKDQIVSRTLQAALTSRTASMITIRKFIQHFYGHMGEMAIDVAASHVVDCIWEGTHGLAFIRERIAEELAENEAQLRESSCGRAVWKNWKMDMYKRRRVDWIKQSKVKASNDGFQSFSELDQNKEKSEGKKTPLQLARERHVKKKNKKERGRGRASSSGARPGVPTGSNAVPTAAASV